MYFSIPIRTIFAVAGSLAILPECNAATTTITDRAFYYIGHMEEQPITGNRQLGYNMVSGTLLTAIRSKKDLGDIYKRKHGKQATSS